MTPSLTGSSPLTRGKPQELPNLLDDLGLIPAHAGKTYTSPRARGALGAHPRSRGENARSRELPKLSDGSSPLTRGKHVDTERVARLTRLIPAHAGKTSSVIVMPTRAAAHPRSRGENMVGALAVLPERGSSPLTRGKLYPSSFIFSFIRLIPAHAGKTESRHR